MQQKYPTSCSTSSSSSSSLIDSALDFLQKLELTSAGRPSLNPNEVEVYSESYINLYDHNNKTPLRGGRCVITTHRLFYIKDNTNPPTALYLPLQSIVRITKEAGFLARSAKIRIDIDPTSRTSSNIFIKLSFKEGGRDEFYEPLEHTLSRRAWQDVQPSHIADRRLQKREFSASDAGIAGILRRQEEAKKETTDLANAAFSDLNHLMNKAKDMVGLIERYVETIKTKEQLQGTENTPDSADDEVTKLSSLMLDMGITSPVTRQNAGAAYYQQLARQLAEFLKVPMEKNGGILTLSDIYCIFNRARGVELISPDDLYQAACLQQSLRLGTHLRKFEGGLIVLQSDSHSEDQVAERLLKMALKSSDGFITSSDVATELHVSLPLSLEYLKVAEQLGKLCRDDTFEGVNFYPNRFDSYLVL